MSDSSTEEPSHKHRRLDLGYDGLRGVQDEVSVPSSSSPVSSPDDARKKGYKVADVRREKKVGVAAGSYGELIFKCVIKFGMVGRFSDCRLFLAEDGTEVYDDEYFSTLPQQTLFILLKKGEKMVTDFDHFYNSIRLPHKEYIETGKAATNFLTTNIKETFRVLQKYIAAADDDRTMLSERTQDPAWFEGLESSEKTKEQWMSKRAKERMRGYYYKIKSALYVQISQRKIHQEKPRSIANRFLTDLEKLLKANKYNDSYFNRNCIEKRLCSETGLFECGGLWNQKECQYEGEHIINPYRSREERIIFQTWNLDHTIELSRSIIPRLLRAVDCLDSRGWRCWKCIPKQKVVIEAERFYLQIFTTENLKLVHIVCHCKKKRTCYFDSCSCCGVPLVRRRAGVPRP